MIQNILKLKSLPKELDATDGIAAAICHYFQNNMEQKKNYSNWKDFIKNNPKRSN
jgi:crossover junction endodeoxyribonuclease RuvC